SLHDALPISLDLQVAAAHPAMERQRQALEVVTAAADAAEAHGGIEIEQQREVGQDAAGGSHVELADQLGIEPAPVALVGHRRVRVAVAQYDTTALEP